jgi:hypothetical protein
MDLALFEQQKGPTLGLDAPQLQVIDRHLVTESLPAPPARCRGTAGDRPVNPMQR